MEQIRILTLTCMYPNKIDGNSGIFIRKQVDSLREKNCLVKVICPFPYSPNILWFNPKWRSYSEIPASEVVGGIEVHHPRYLRLPGKTFHGLACYSMDLGTRNRIDSIMKEFKPHVIHAQMATPVGYVGLMLRRRYNLPLVCSIRGSDIHTYPQFGRLSARLTREVLSGTDQVVSVSKALRAEAERIARPRKEINVIYNGCDSDAFTNDKESRNVIRKKLGISIRDKAIIFVGKICRNKGVYELVDVFRHLAGTYTGLHLILVGDGPDLEAVRNMASSGGLANKVHLAGTVSHGEVSQWLSSADIFALPSRNEGLPNVILEAMACSLPVVASRVGGIPEAVTDGESGILVGKEDLYSLTSAIKHLLVDEEGAEKMGILGRKLVERRFSWERNADQMVTIYEDAVRLAAVNNL